jgi:phosphopantothenoylcysteine decarboxylase/phosphopantothenate--cysteine ligase
MKVIVTSGATREPIDSVRFISNLSSGRTGATICEVLVARGYAVTQLHGVDSTRAMGVIRREEFTDHISLDSRLRAMLRDGDCDTLIHAAAVGDFRIDKPHPHVKLESGRELELRLRPTPKIIDRIRGYAVGRPMTLVGFKLTHDPDVSRQAGAARELLARCGADYIVQNDVTDIGDDAGHRFVIYSRGGEECRDCAGRRELAEFLAELLKSPGSGSRT